MLGQRNVISGKIQSSSCISGFCWMADILPDRWLHGEEAILLKEYKVVYIGENNKNTSFFDDWNKRCDERIKITYLESIDEP